MAAVREEIKVGQEWRNKSSHLLCTVKVLVIGNQPKQKKITIQHVNCDHPHGGHPIMEFASGSLRSDYRLVQPPPTPVKYHNPGEVLNDVMAFSSRDWAANKEDALLFGIIAGWDREYITELAAKFGWPDAHVVKMAGLHQVFVDVFNLEGTLA